MSVITLGEGVAAMVAKKSAAKRSVSKKAAKSAVGSGATPAAARAGSARPAAVKAVSTHPAPDGVAPHRRASARATVKTAPVLPPEPTAPRHAAGQGPPAGGVQAATAAHTATGGASAAKRTPAKATAASLREARHPADEGEAGSSPRPGSVASATEGGRVFAGEPLSMAVTGATPAPKRAARTPAVKKPAVKAAEGTGTDAAEAVSKTGAGKVVAKRSTVKKSPAKKSSAKGAGTRRVAADGAPLPKATAAVKAPAPGELAVRPGEEPWTPQEIAEARAELEGEAERLRTEMHTSEEALAGLMRDSGDGAGDDQADTGTKNITREHELSLAANARDMLEQTEHALQRLEAGTYGLCESCGNPIGKARMQAFRRATLCVDCKQKQERRT
ncbi:TraR/DksA C4-type zinc finger protein [Streptomyces sp. NPDC006879]|uniref:TraR/DksA C4-type zinc finger protein n=1 Tax=Streptomyces sp. NPDC006879 TaxID=3364767 RepID=UPI0036C770C7